MSELRELAVLLAHMLTSGQLRLPMGSTLSTQQDLGLYGRDVHRVDMHRGSRQPLWVPGGRAGQDFGM